MILRAAAPLTLVVLLAAAAACDGAASRPSAGQAEVDEWGEDVAPPTRAEILAAPGEHGADAVAQALVEVADSADTGALSSVLALTNDEREEIRWHAVLALAAIGGDEARATLARLAVEDPSELVRDAAAQR